MTMGHDDSTTNIVMAIIAIIQFIAQPCAATSLPIHCTRHSAEVPTNTQEIRTAFTFSLSSMGLMLSGANWLGGLLARPAVGVTDLDNGAISTDTHCIHTHTHTHPFNSPLSGTTRMSRYQKGETNLDFTEAKDSEVEVASAGPYASLHLTPDR